MMALYVVVVVAFLAWNIVHYRHVRAEGILAHERDRYRAALDEVSRVLGTGACDVPDCQGCKWEMQEAAGIAARALFTPKVRDRLWHNATVSRETIAAVTWRYAQPPHRGGFRSRTRVARVLRTWALTVSAVPVVARFARTIVIAYVNAWRSR